MQSDRLPYLRRPRAGKSSLRQENWICSALPCEDKEGERRILVSAAQTSLGMMTARFGRMKIRLIHVYLQASSLFRGLQTVSGCVFSCTLKSVSGSNWNDRVAADRQSSSSDKPKSWGDEGKGLVRFSARTMWIEIALLSNISLIQVFLKMYSSQ